MLSGIRDTFGRASNFLAVIVAFAAMLAAACGSDGESAAGSSITRYPDAPLLIEFSEAVADPARTLTVPDGWRIEGKAPGRAFVLRPPTSASGHATVTVEPGTAGYEAGLWLQLSSVPTSSSKPAFTGNVQLDGEDGVDPKTLQRSVSDGHQPWRIVPQEVAMEFLHTRGYNLGSLAAQAVHLTPADLRLLLRDTASDHRFEVILARADTRSTHPAWIVTRATASHQPH